MARQTKPETKLSEAADKATALLQGLQSRLAGQRDTPHPESPEDLDRQLREYFVGESGKNSQDTSMLDEIRERVIDAVADRILQNWERGDHHEFGPIEKQVIDRVAERIIARMAKR